jgi:hypothetical protein
VLKITRDDLKNQMSFFYILRHALYHAPHDIHDQPDKEKYFTVHPNLAFASIDEYDLITTSPIFVGIHWFHPVPPELILPQQ